jgi:hypothetical protein
MSQQNYLSSQYGAVIHFVFSFYTTKSVSATKSRIRTIAVLYCYLGTFYLDIRKYSGILKSVKHFKNSQQID